MSISLSSESESSYSDSSSSREDINHDDLLELRRSLAVIIDAEKSRHSRYVEEPIRLPAPYLPGRFSPDASLYTPSARSETTLDNPLVSNTEYIPVFQPLHENASFQDPSDESEDNSYVKLKKSVTDFFKREYAHQMSSQDQENPSDDPYQPSEFISSESIGDSNYSFPVNDPRCGDCCYSPHLIDDITSRLEILHHSPSRESPQSGPKDDLDQQEVSEDSSYHSQEPQPMGAVLDELNTYLKEKGGSFPEETSDMDNMDANEWGSDESTPPPEGYPEEAPEPPEALVSNQAADAHMDIFDHMGMTPEQMMGDMERMLTDLSNFFSEEQQRMVQESEALMALLHTQFDDNPEGQRLFMEQMAQQEADHPAEANYPEDNQPTSQEGTPLDVLTMPNAGNFMGDLLSDLSYSLKERMEFHAEKEERAPWPSSVTGRHPGVREMQKFPGEHLRASDDEPAGLAGLPSIIETGSLGTPPREKDAELLMHIRHEISNIFLDEEVKPLEGPEPPEYDSNFLMSLLDLPPEDEKGIPEQHRWQGQITRVVREPSVAGESQQNFSCIHPPGCLLSNEDSPGYQHQNTDARSSDAGEFQEASETLIIESEETIDPRSRYAPTGDLPTYFIRGGFT